MTKLFVLCKLIKGYANEGVVFEWPLSTHYALSEVLLQMHMKSSSDQVGPTLVFDAGAWLLKDDWHDDAYEQLLSMRRLYSSQLDDAYTSIYIPRLCNVLSLEARKFLKKSLVFLATSRAEMVSLSIEKCYYRMMLIKFFAVLSSVGVHANQHPYKLQGHGSRSQIQSESLPYWRDLVHEEIGAIRKEYSYALDEAFRTKLGLCAEKPALDLFKTFNESFFEEALDFLGYSRAEIASESEAKCTDYMKRIREFGRQILNSSHEDSRRGLAKFIEFLSRPCQVQNWRDEAYAEIKSKETKFWKVQAACEKVHVMSSYKIIPSLATQWEEELGNSLGRTREFFTMSRSNLARLSKEEYDTRVEVINGDLARIEEKLTCLQISLGKRISFPCDFCKVKLKQRSNA